MPPQLLLAIYAATLARVVCPPKKRRTASPTSFFQGFREN
jgi:hypothetical protein